MKSYGRAPTFLMLTGYEQVRSIAAAIAGDWDAARDVQLVLPETGVCSSGILAERGVACCAASRRWTTPQTPPAAPSPATSASAAASASCCGTAAPQVIQLSGALSGGCCR